MPSQQISLGQAAYDTLSRLIVSGELQPGQRVTERQLSADTGLGLTPVREALTRLSQERLVITVPRRGYLIAPITAKGVNDLFEIWRHVCGAIAELAVRKATPVEIEQICAALDGDQAAAADGADPLTRVAHGSDLFVLLSTVARNDLLSDVYAQLSIQMARLFALVFRHHRIAAPSVGGRSLADHVRRRDATAVRDLVMGYNDLVHHHVLEELRTRDAAGG